MRIVILLLFILHFFNGTSQQTSLAETALELTKDRVTYDPSYFSIPYPMGDIPADKGVCTDVVIRAYRKIGVDLQQLVHEDMKANFRLYPNNWGLTRTDPNIDHRRVPNLMTFFERFGETKPKTNDVADYQPGDIVCWDLGKGINHIGIVVTHHNGTEHRPLIVHNIGAGQVLQDFLFEYPIIGHFRYEKPEN